MNGFFGSDSACRDVAAGIVHGADGLLIGLIATLVAVSLASFLVLFLDIMVVVLMIS